jgi:hypothetical protein
MNKRNSIPAPSSYLVTAIEPKTGYKVRKMCSQKLAAEAFAAGLKGKGWTVPAIVFNPKNIDELVLRDQKEELNRVCLARNTK